MKEDLFHLGIKALIQNSEGKILLLQVNLAKLKGTKKAYWDIPGGRIQKGESVELTLQRELAEETGISKIRKVSPFSMVLSNIRIPVGKSDVGLILATYLCEIDVAEPIKISQEHTKSNWFTHSQAAKLLSTKYPADFVEKIEKLNS